MIVDGWSRYPSMAKMLNAPHPKAMASVTDGRATPAAPNSSSSGTSGDTVQISAAARAASDNLRSTSTEKGGSLKARVDKLFQDARDRGSFITFDSSKGGEWMDVSSFTDDELAQITNDKNHQFPKDLSNYAGGALGQRLKVVLEPYEYSVNNGDRRAHTMTIDKLWNQMTPATRKALNWTPTMMISNDSMLKGDTKIFGLFDENTVIDNLVNAAQRGGLSFSTAQH